MHGDFSRITFDDTKHFKSVRQQQGRLALDADWNEQADITSHRIETEAKDVIGQFGAAEHSAGFNISSPATSDFQISAGRYYVDGILCVNESPTSYRNQPDLKLDRTTSLPTNALVYLDVWERHITALDDDDIREKALGGPDTTSRIKTVWQVKVLELKQTPQPSEIEGFRENLKQQKSLTLAEWQALTAYQEGQMDARPKPGDTTIGANPCQPTPLKAGYSGLENQLYRVEIHKAGKLNEARFKWSRDNGCVVAAIKEIDKDEIVLSDSGCNDISRLDGAEWGEITSDINELSEKGEAGQLVRITIKRDGATPVVSITPPQTPVTKADCTTQHHRLRRWDQAGTAPADGILVTGGLTPLENDIQVQFTPGEYRAGDYWLIPARTVVAAAIEWPATARGSSRPPDGVKHHYCPLAIIASSSVYDLRQVFRPLNQIEPADSIFTVVLTPDSNWGGILARQLPKEGGLVGFRAGTYDLDRPLILQGTGCVRIVGAGSATQIRALKSEAALVFRGWESVTVEDLSTAAGVAIHTSKPAPNLNGTVMFQDCGSVTVERVTASCGAGIRRRVACLSILNTSGGGANATCSVRIRGCDLHPGDRQVGIQVVNAGRVVVDDNVIQPIGGPAAKTVPEIFRDRRFRREFARLLVRDLKINAQPANPKKVVATIRYQGFTAHLVTDPALARLWQKLVTIEKPKGIDSDQKLRAYLRRRADAVIEEKGTVETVRPGGIKERWQAFGDWYQRMGKAGLTGDPLTDEMRARLRQELAADVRASSWQPSVANRAAEVTHGGMMLSFATEPTLVNEWQNLVALTNPQNIQKPQELADWLWAELDKILRAGVAPAGLTELNKWLAGLTRNYQVTAAQGIVVAGSSQLDVRIVNNSVNDVQQGIHVGLSRKSAPRSHRDVATRVAIDANTVGVRVAPTATGLSHGVSVGNVRSLAVTSNRVTVDASDASEVHGIHVVGQLGPIVIIRENDIEKAYSGIFVRALAGSNTPPSQWVVSHNLTSGAKSSIDVPREMRDFENCS